MGSLLVSPHEVPDTAELREYMKKAESPTASFDRLKVLIYGKPKRGKTRFLGTWPNILILEFDPEGAGVLAGVENFRGKVVNVTSWEDVRMWYWILARAKHKFQAVAWDTVSMAQEIALRSVLQEKAEKKDGKDPYHAEPNDYGRSARLLRTWIGMYANLPMHFLLTAHEREGESPDEATGDDIAVWLVPDLQKSVAGFVQGLVGAIGYAYRTVDKETKQKHFKIAFERKHTNAEDRHGILPRVLEPATYDEMMKYVKEYVKEAV